jgi:uncharacterized membrane protein YdfJ with MMPL/SSD domain
MEGMRRWAKFVLAHRSSVVLFWLAVLVGGGIASGPASERLTIEYSLPGEPGAKTAEQINETFGNGGYTAPYLVSVTYPEGRTVAGNERAVAAAFDAVEAEVPAVRVLDEANTGDAAFRAEDGRSVDVVKRVRDRAEDLPGVIGVNGIGAMKLDFVDAVYGNFPLMFMLIALLTFVLLVRAFRSLLLPLKPVLLNLLSLGATYGLVVLFWQYGFGSETVFDSTETGAITFWVPLLIFAFLFGLSMDYEVFILARLREEYDATGSTDRSIIQVIGRTGRLVTNAALILFLAFTALAASPPTDIKVLATGLGFGILLDATVIRSLLPPATVSLFGDWNWYLPASLARILRVRPSQPVTEKPVPDLAPVDERLYR